MLRRRTKRGDRLKPYPKRLVEAKADGIGRLA
jgi:hypothetical protein